MSEVKRWTLWTVSESGCELEPYSEESPDGTYIKASDYDQLKAENERLQMQLVACGVIALANTPESACEARKMHPDYMSASCSDVANAVDREMELRTQLAEARELLEESSDMVNGCEDMFLQQRIDAWLEANDK